MKREQLHELHYICPIVNVASIMQYGVLSHSRANHVKHVSVAMPEVQARRRDKKVLGGRYLHDYVNLYIHARNPTMYKLHADNESVCVLRVDARVLDIPGTIITDQNAASDDALFAPALDGLQYVEEGLVFATYWTHPDDPEEEQRHKRVKCAEVLVPDRVGQEFVIGAYVSCKQHEVELQRAAPTLRVYLNPHLFFL